MTAAPKGPKLLMSPSRAKVGDTVRITVQGFKVGAAGVSAWGSGDNSQSRGPSGGGAGGRGKGERGGPSMCLSSLSSCQLQL